jgi:hypothetical protein
MVFQSSTKDFLHKFKHDQHYYVDIPHSPFNIEEQTKEFNGVNLDDSLDVLQETLSSTTLTHGSMFMHNLFLLPCSYVRWIKGKEQLVDYSQSHVVTFD